MTSIATQLQAFTSLTTKQIQKAAARSLNRAIVSVRAEASREVKKTLNAKAADIKDAIDLGKASYNDSLASMYATVTVTGKPMPLVAFLETVQTLITPRGSYQQVYVRVKKGGQRKLVEGAFVATVGNGHQGIFRRIGDKRLPIKELYSTSVMDLFRNNDELVKDLLAYGRDKFSDNFESELRYQLSLT